jgi:hypothetical protein
VAVEDISRRAVIKGGGLLGLAALLPPQVLAWARAQAAGAPSLLFFTPHQADVVREATARLIPGPDDDLTELGHPGARQANVVRYIDLMLGALTVTPEKVHAGGPWSDRKGGDANHMATFVPLSVAQRRGWGQRLAKLQQAYRDGVALLDGKGFLAASVVERDLILAMSDVAPFRDLMFGHAIEGTYCLPEYGGNENQSGWKEIKFPGDSQPRGYTPAEVSGSDGPDVAPMAAGSPTAKLLDQLQAAGALYARRRPGGR